MNRYTPEELQEVLRLHTLWVRGEDGGERANLWGANLWGADLQGADLQGADLWGADLRGADLRGADLWGADLQGADLQGADLQGANLQGLKISAIRVFSGLYEYQCQAVVSEDGAPWIRMGCLWKSLEDWDSIGIRKSNISEFPDDGSDKSERRARAFDYVRAEVLVMAEKFKAEQAA
ncbi:MAG: pentapeptide repeat-containing protein [Bryobacteraceae bacterium]